jgi:hypothetical protein
MILFWSSNAEKYRNRILNLVCFNYYSKDKKENVSRETGVFLFLERKKTKIALEFSTQSLI